MDPRPLALRAGLRYVLVAVSLVLLNKPAGVLSQFRDSEGRGVLADYLKVPGVYPAGRLDFMSEGLLALTDDGRLQARIAEPGRKLAKHYWAQVEGTPTALQLDRLRQGVTLKDGPAGARSVATIPQPAGLWPRNPPIRERRNIPTGWLDIAISEGRNRQVRRMTAAVGLPTLRLIRHRIGPWSLDGLAPGEYRILETAEAWRMLG
jgi:23S rRNA pseudouridine2457 synthase